MPPTVRDSTMKCQHCQSLAEVAVWIELPSGKMTVELCRACLRRHLARLGLIPWLPVLKESIPLKPVLVVVMGARDSHQFQPGRPRQGKLLLGHQRGTALMSSETVDLAKLRCPDCGTTFVDFRKTGRMGCPYDYVVFRGALLPLLDRVHRAKHHTGKTPSHLREVVEVHGEMRRLRFELKSAIEAEDYDRAAQLRDQIRAKEQEYGS